MRTFVGDVFVYVRKDRDQREVTIMTNTLVVKTRNYCSTWTGAYTCSGQQNYVYLMEGRVEMEMAEICRLRLGQNSRCWKTSTQTHFPMPSVEPVTRYTLSANLLPWAAGHLRAAV